MQAASGTPLSEPPTAEDDPPRTRLIGLVLSIAAALLVLDQVTKALAIAGLEDRAPVELLGGLVTLTLVRNPGAAFGVAAGYTIVVTLIALAVSVVIVRVSRTLTSVPWAVALGLLLGGALGNLVDRVFREPGFLQGHVIDFIDTPVTLVFNLADAAIMCAGALMVVLTIRGVPLRATEDAAADEAEAA